MEISFIIAVITLIIVFTLGLLVLARNSRSTTHQTFSALVFFIGFWLADSLFINLSTNLADVFFWSQMSIVWTAAIPALWVYFAHIFPKKHRIKRFKQVILILPPLFFLMLSPTRGNIQMIKLNADGSWQITYGYLYPLLLIYLFLFISWGFICLLRNYRASQGIIKVQIKYIFIGALLSSLFALAGSIFLPSFGKAAINFSLLTALFFVIFSTYAVLKHHLLQVKVITAEVFTGLLLLVLLINLFTLKTKEQFILNSSLLGSAIVFGIFLIRSVLQEIRAREKVELMAQKVKKANYQLRKLNQSKSEFISIASHQLRTPLSAIKGYVSMILDGTYGPLDKQKREILELVYSSNERLIGLINDLLNLSRIERGKLQFEFRPVNINEILDSVVKELKVNASKKKLKIIYTARDLPLLQADPYKLRQVFVNILDNAIKYTEKGSIRIKTQIKLHKIVIIFKDTGLGMTPDEITSIYDKFRRGRGGEKYHVGGMGIGLYICYKIIEAHHGKLYAKSKGVNKGTTFYVELPY